MPRIVVEGSANDRRYRVVERSDGSRLYYDDGILYTQVDAAGANQLPYIDVMAVELGRPNRLLMLGAAGGGLATLCSRQGVQVTAVDNGHHVFDIARRWFHLPQSVECQTADALSFLTTTDRRWDAIAIDLFRGTEIPAAVLIAPMGALLAKALEPGGVVVWNAPDVETAACVAGILREAGLAPTIRSVFEDAVGNHLVLARAG